MLALLRVMIYDFEYDAQGHLPATCERKEAHQ